VLLRNDAVDQRRHEFCFVLFRSPDRKSDGWFRLEASYDADDPSRVNWLPPQVDDTRYDVCTLVWSRKCRGCTLSGLCPPRAHRNMRRHGGLMWRKTQTIFQVFPRGDQSRGCPVLSSAAPFADPRRLCNLEIRPQTPGQA